MKKQKTNTRILYGGLAVLLIVAVAGVIAANRQEPEEYTFPQPEEVVNQYFSSWNSKDYPNMYAAISDGFKRIEPTAKTLQDFKSYVGSQPIKGVSITSIDETSNDGSTAAVDYDVQFMLADETIKPYEGTFTLKNRQGDVIRGWKLIHPYGENIDRG